MKIPDLALNILLPLSIGAAIYAWPAGIGRFPLVRHHLPDLLWAYAFTSAILIIWNRKPNYFWLITVLLAGILFEWLQYKKLINGTGDLLDLPAYLAGFFVALFLNRTFKPVFKP